MDQGSLAPISNRADWPDSHAFELFDDVDNSVIDLTTATAVTLEIRDQDSCRPVLIASLANGDIVLQGAETFIPTWTASQLGCLCAGTYDIGCTAVVNGKTIQLIIGTLPVLEGIVR
jgi:hypothetical protein